MKRVTLVAALVVVFSVPVAAATTTRSIASDLGVVLAAEELCGLKFDPAGVEAYIAANVPADDFEFPGQLSNAITANKASNYGLQGSQKVAICAQVSRLAQTYGFTR